MTETLPDEVLDDILAYRLTLPHTDFLAFPGSGPGLAPSRCSDLVLVSKRWLRIGTPLLYECVRLATPEHAAAVAELLRTQPQVGRAVRCLRLEGGFGRDLEHIAAATTRLERLYVAMSVKAADDNITGLENSLPLFHCRHLYLENNDGRRCNRKAVEVRKALEAYIPGAGPSLKSLALSDSFQGMDETFASAIAASSVEELSCQTSSMERWIVNRLMHTMLEGSQLQRVVCRGLYRESSIRIRLQRTGLVADMGKFAFVRHIEDDEVEAMRRRREEALSQSRVDRALRTMNSSE